MIGRSFFVPALLSILLFATSAAGETHYVTQSGAGNRDGSSAANAWSAADFNALSGTGYAGDIIYFSGEFSTRIAVQISGTPGGGDVILEGWETGTCAPTTSEPPCVNAADLKMGMDVSANMGYIIIRDFQMTTVSLPPGYLPTLILWEGVNHVAVRKNYIYDSAARSFDTVCNSSKCEYIIVEENRVKNFAKLINPSENFDFQHTEHLLIKNNVVSMEPDFQHLCSSCNVAATHTCQNVMVEGNEFYGGVAPDGTGFAPKEWGPQGNYIFRYNKFHDSFAGITLGTSDFAQTGADKAFNFYVYANYFYNNGIGGSSYYNADTHYWWSNIFEDNLASGIVLWTQDQNWYCNGPGDPHACCTGSHTGTCIMTPPTNIHVYSNTFVRNGDHDPLPDAWTRGGLVLSWANNNYAMNNIFYNNRPLGIYGYQQIVDNTNSVTLDYNMLYHTSSAATWHYGGAERSLDVMQTTYGQEEHGAVQDPRLTDPNNSDYTLQPTSTSINTGVDLSQCFNVELSGDDSWFEDQTGYSTVEVCLNEALHPSTDWTTTPPTVITVNQNNHGSGWERGAYAYVPIDILPPAAPQNLQVR